MYNKGKITNKQGIKMKKANGKLQSMMSCKATASLEAQVADDLDKEDENLEEIMEKAENDNKCRKSACKCRKKD